MAGAVVQKEGELFVVCDERLDINPDSADGAGLYFRDTRHLSVFQLLVEESPLEVLDRVSDAVELGDVYLTNAQPIQSGEDLVPALALVCRRQRRLGDQLREHVSITNHSRATARLRIRLNVASDFRDVFDVRGFFRHHDGQVLPPQADDGGCVLGFDGASGARYRSRVSARPAATEIQLAPGSLSATFRHDLTIPPGTNATVEYQVEPRIEAVAASSGRPRMATAHDLTSTVIETSNALFNAMLDRSLADLRALWTPLPDGGNIIAAGIPWYVAAFGRDSLIVSRQLLPFDPAIAAGTLRFLASTQGTATDPWRDEQPGKIVHEMRFGELARLNVVPFARYYGTVDATALFLLVLAEYLDWTADRALFDELRVSIDAALGWLDGPGDANGDGFVDYTPRTDGGLVNQAWKDSHDSVQRADGQALTPPLAPVEMQGYVYAAKLRLATHVERFGDAALAGRLRADAERMHAAVEGAFWNESIGSYVDVLDGQRRQTGSDTSNPGHLLACGLPSAERAARVARHLLSPELFSGWGVRTLSSVMPHYHPVSYHNGSVWPHDNGFALWGLRRYRHFAELAQLATALFDAAARFPLYRLPELFCGFSRGASRLDRPVTYPTTCSPQAWAAGTPLVIVETLLGLHADAASGELTFDPWLPAWLERVELRGLQVAGQRIDVRVSGHQDSVTVDVLENPGGLRVTIGNREQGIGNRG